MKKVLCSMLLIVSVVAMCLFFGGCGQAVVQVESPVKYNLEDDSLMLSFQSHIETNNEEVIIHNSDTIKDMITQLSDIAWYQQNAEDSSIYSAANVNMIMIKNSEQHTCINLIGTDDDFGYVSVTQNNSKENYCIKIKDYKKISSIFNKGIKA